ncbi:hypothetical protein HPB50_025348 [Hyalomma asiaticum]|uniref:Uncharacterized protein n=1 Tax=Hyalomma asiaticum TaxID=266040 RepID=A0ACB7S046_HYAAI|nr:hypothetical protein HPB50_025348 [Hyalomma asiaticum]
MGGQIMQYLAGSPFPFGSSSMVLRTWVCQLCPPMVFCWLSSPCLSGYHHHRKLHEEPWQARGTFASLEEERTAFQCCTNVVPVSSNLWTLRDFQNYKGKMSKDVGKKQERRRHHRKKKAAEGGATSASGALPSSLASMSGVASPTTGEQSPAFTGFGQSAPAGPVTITEQPGPPSKSVPREEASPPDPGSSGHLIQGGTVPTAATSSPSGVNAGVAATKPDGGEGQRPQLERSEGDRAAQVEPVGVGTDANSASTAATSSFAKGPAESSSTTKDRNEGVSVAPTALVSTAQTEPPGASEGHAQHPTTAKAGRTISAQGSPAGAAVSAPQPPVSPAKEIKGQECMPIPGASPGILKRGRMVLPLGRLADIPRRAVMTPPAISPPQGPVVSPKNRWLPIVLAVCGILALLCFLAIFLSSSQRRPTVRSLVCSTDSCRKHAALLTENLDWTLDPCEDFQAFVCSAARGSSDRSENFKTVIDKLRLSWYHQLRDILIGGSLKLRAGRKALAMYKWCRDEYPSDAPEAPQFLEFLQDRGLDWPELPSSPEPAMQLLIRLAYMWNCQFWITVTLLKVQDSSSTGPAARRRVQVRTSELVPILLRHHKAAKPVYVKYWGQFLSHMYPDSSERPPIDSAVVDEVRNIEEQILETLNTLVRARSPKPAVFPFGELSTYVPNASANEWLAHFQQSIPLERPLSSDDEIVVSDVGILLTIAELLRKYNDAQLARHLTWLVVQYYAPVADYRMLVDHYGSKDKAAAYLPVYCGHQIEESYKVLVAALDLVHRFTAQDIKTIDDGFEHVASAAVDRVAASDWMDDESKARLTAKISATKKLLWPPHAIVNADTLEKLYDGFPEEATSFATYWMTAKLAGMWVNTSGPYEETMRLLWNSMPGYVAYDYVLNTIELAMGAVGPPVYYQSGAKAMLYGGLLFLMATYLVRAFDAEGVMWTPNGTRVDTILSNATMSEYRVRERCRVNDTVEQSLFPEVPAFAIAYTAMKQAHVRDGSEPLALRVDLSEDKTFFMTLCYLSCQIAGKRNAAGFDCNKVARNSKAFAKAFRCHPGSKMNPDKKCYFFVG